MSLVGTAISQVFYQRGAEAHAQGRLAPLVDEAFNRLVLLGLFPMLALTLVGGRLATMVFGNAWTEAGVYTQILGIWAFFWFISQPMSNLFMILEKQEFHLKINILLFITRLVSLGLGGYLGSPRLALVFFAITGILVYGYLSASILVYSGTSWHRIWSILVQALSYFIPFGIVLVGELMLDLNNWIIALTTLVGLAAYGFIVWRRHPETVRGLVRR
jgi:O-antigen/teichoic acid export membrane protein